MKGDSSLILCSYSVSVGPVDEMFVGCNCTCAAQSLCNWLNMKAGGHIEYHHNEEFDKLRMFSATFLWLSMNM